MSFRTMYTVTFYTMSYTVIYIFVQITKLLSLCCLQYTGFDAQVIGMQKLNLG